MLISSLLRVYGAQLYETETMRQQFVVAWEKGAVAVSQLDAIRPHNAWYECVWWTAKFSVNDHL